MAHKMPYSLVLDGKTIFESNYLPYMKRYANAVVQHGGFDKIDLSAMERLYAQRPERKRNGLEGELSEKFIGG